MYDLHAKKGIHSFLRLDVADVWRSVIRFPKVYCSILMNSSSDASMMSVLETPVTPEHVQ